MKHVMRRMGKIGMCSRLAVALGAMGLAASLSAQERKPATSADYPAYRGDGSGATDSRLELVRSWSDARRVWASEEPAPPVGRGPHGDTNAVGGYGVPVVAGDSVYVGYLIPTGPTFEGCLGKTGQPLADEVVICMDAKTGKTVWRTVFAGKGWNFCAVYPSDGQITPCVAQGKVLMQGSTGWAYCLDAQSGKVHWEKPTGKTCLAWDGFKAAVLAGTEKPKRMSYPDLKFAQAALAPRPPANPEHGGSGGGGFNSTPMVFGDLAVFNAAGAETVAFDLATGQERWRRRGTMSSSASVVKWTHEGKEYLVGHGVCVDPATGKDLWTFGPLGGGYQGYTPAISGDLWVGVGNNGKTARGENRMFVVCYRFSPQGAKVVWRLPDDTNFTYMSPVIHRGRLYATMGWPKLTPEETETVTGIKDYAGPLLSGDTCIDMVTGKVLGNIGNANNDQGTSPFAMDGRVFTHGAFMFDAQPEAKGIWKPLATLKPRTQCCTFPTGANGFLYLRAAGSKSLVECWDLRGKEIR